MAAQGAGADALLVTYGPDVRWLSGFTGSNGVVVLVGKQAVLFTDGRYTTQARAEVPDMRVVVGKGSAVTLAVAFLTKRGARRCAFDARHTSVAVLEAMREALPESIGAHRRKFFVPAEGLMSRLREIKDNGEIEVLRRAAALGCALFADLQKHIHAGRTVRARVEPRR